MNSAISSAPHLFQKSDSSDRVSPQLPLGGIEALARLWAGSGTLLDWIAPEDWGLDLAWSAAQVRARVADLILGRFARDYLKFLPRHAGEWVDLISQQLQRNVNRTELPTAHTDWPSTLSEYGRYPSELYIERRPIATYDTPHTRVLKWTAGAVRRAEVLVQSQFGRAPLRQDERKVLTCALELAEVASASDAIKPSDIDLDICKSSGAVWLLVGRFAEELSALWFGSPTKQFFSLAPTLPEFGHQLFEIGALGTVLNELRKKFGSQGWSAENPLAAAKSNRPCLAWSNADAQIRIFFQTTPIAATVGSAPYLSLARKIGGGSLRPDAWIAISGNSDADLILECKYSHDPSYVASAITQLIGYNEEYPSTGRLRLLVAVGPAEVIPQPWSWNSRVILCNPNDAASLVAAAASGGANELMKNWRVD